MRKRFFIMILLLLISIPIVHIIFKPDEEYIDTMNTIVIDVGEVKVTRYLSKYCYIIVETNNNESICLKYPLKNIHYNDSGFSIKPGDVLLVKITSERIQWYGDMPVFILYDIKSSKL